MELQTPEQRTAIRELNDEFRKTFVGGLIMLTYNVEELSPDVRKRVLERVRTFEDFTNDNDPHSEHDMGFFKIDGMSLWWKVDCYDRNLTYASPNSGDPSVTTRVLTVGTAEEY